MRIRGGRGRVLLITAVALVLAAGCSSRGPAAGTPRLEKTDLNVAVVPALDSAGFFVALYGGLFKAHGLNVHFTPATRSPDRTGASAGASRTRPRDSCPMTSRGPPAGGCPPPRRISASVPQMPASSPSTRTEPSSVGGSGSSAISSEPGRPGITLIAFTSVNLSSQARLFSGAPVPIPAAAGNQRG